LKSGGCETAFFYINSKNENLQSDGDGKYAPEDIAKKMPQKEPRYAITKFRHVTPAEVGDGKQQQVAPFVFVYFCPDSAHPRLKMAYSSCKSIAVKLCEKYGIDIAKQFEYSEPSELTSSGLIAEIYPKASEKKVFAKPKTAAGKGGKRLTGGAKFNADK